MKDMKEALGSSAKADITHVRAGMRNYTARACEYGNDKYERANYLRPTGEAAHTRPTRADFERLRVYLRGAISHFSRILDAMELHQATDPALLDVEGMRRAAYAPDTDPGNDKVGPSNLPHFCGGFASAMMGLEQAINAGLLPADPGVTWEKKAQPIAVGHDERDVVRPAEVAEQRRCIPYKFAVGDRVKIGGDARAAGTVGYVFALEALDGFGRPTYCIDPEPDKRVGCTGMPYANEGQLEACPFQETP